MMRSFINYKKSFFLLGLFLLPFLIHAQAPPVEDLFDYFNFSTKFISQNLIRVAMFFALTFFLAGVFKYVNAGDNAEKRASGVKIITHGLIALFLAVSVWAIVALMVNTFFPGQDQNQFKPKVTGL